MNTPQEVLWFVVVFAGGVALGGIFFGGLWLTTRYLATASGGPLLVILSFLSRVSLVLLGIYWLTNADWQYVLTCLGGFLVARTVILRKVVAPKLSSQTQEASSHERVSG